MLCDDEGGEDDYLDIFLSNTKGTNTAWRFIEGTVGKRMEAFRPTVPSGFYNLTRFIVTKNGQEQHQKSSCFVNN